MSISQGGPVTSFVQSNSGVGASVPLPEMGQMAGLAGLSVFSAPFTVGAVEALCAQDGTDAVEDLSVLVDHSMVSPAERPDGQRAFRLR